MHNNPKLLKAYRAGKSEAYEVLYHEFKAPLERMLRKGFAFSSRGRLCSYQGVASEFDLDGLVQETFLRAFSESARNGYDGERPFRNYIFSIAKHLVLRSYHRKERLTKAELTQDACDAITLKAPGAFERAGELSAEHDLREREIGELMRSYVASLDCEERSFFALRFSKGLTQQATADEMQVTRARIKLLEKRLRADLLAYLRDQGYFQSYTPQPRWTRKVA